MPRTAQHDIPKVKVGFSIHPATILRLEREARCHKISRSQVLENILADVYHLDFENPHRESIAA